MKLSFYLPIVNYRKEEDILHDQELIRRHPPEGMVRIPPSSESPRNTDIPCTSPEKEKDNSTICSYPTTKGRGFK